MKPAAELGRTILKYDTKQQKYKKAKCLYNRSFKMSGYWPLSQQNIGMRVLQNSEAKVAYKNTRKID